jgi:hypothetical protein
MSFSLASAFGPICSTDRRPSASTCSVDQVGQHQTPDPKAAGGRQPTRFLGKCGPSQHLSAEGKPARLRAQEQSLEGHDRD